MSEWRRGYNYYFDTKGAEIEPGTGVTNEFLDGWWAARLLGAAFDE